ncbi:MAG TPA: hypothetical protein VGF10_04960 [Gaiella sp.]|jgi:hypothetical protein
MRRSILVAVLIAAVVVPSVLAADPTPAEFKNAAKYCKAVRESKGAESFAALYGTNKNRKNAYGKCVSKAAKAKVEASEGKQDAAAPNAAVQACKKQKADDAATFAQKYKNLGQCIKAGKTASD